MSDRLTAWLRTVVPALWASLAGVYALLRGLEPHLPNWLTVILLGSSRPPTYPAGTNGGMHAA